jgi:hypothetical protein
VEEGHPPRDCVIDSLLVRQGPGQRSESARRFLTTPLVIKDCKRDNGRKSLCSFPIFIQIVESTEAAYND